MEISEFNKMQGTNSENLAVKIFTETCCNGCTCSSSSDHKTESQIKLDSSCLCGNQVCNC